MMHRPREDAICAETRDQQPAASGQRPAASNQQPATSNQLSYQLNYQLNYQLVLLLRHQIRAGRCQIGMA